MLVHKCPTHVFHIADLEIRDRIGYLIARSFRFSQTLFSFDFTIKSRSLTFWEPETLSHTLSLAIRCAYKAGSKNQSQEHLLKQLTSSMDLWIVTTTARRKIKLLILLENLFKQQNAQMGCVVADNSGLRHIMIIAHVFSTVTVSVVFKNHVPALRSAAQAIMPVHWK